MPFPTPGIRRFLRLIVLEFFHRPALSFWPALSGLDTALGALASRPYITQQFQKNAYHNDKCVISEVMIRLPVEPSYEHPGSGSQDKLHENLNSVILSGRS